MTLTTVWFAFFLIVVWRRRASFHRLLKRYPLFNQTMGVFKSLGEIQLPHQAIHAFYMRTSLAFFALVFAVTFSWAT